ncbi:hypothetical protein JKG41_09935 [Acidithiobacillus sp. MC2.1]|uniref:Conserved domain protein, putative n=2 Tax=Acidithiobacillaceae TaxID=225058 RepID=B7J852_ACIF2|nr:conserved domain protein, putative [Acidithiobacillus ferrooxidans ATCC 23270]MBN6745376.1 hypothetical protein [Acidithiobacillus sp. MC2.2]MBN6748217.1 hypothetical protein [Acidithiobacillus sp. PG05]
MKLRAAILLALFAGLPAVGLSDTAQAASVYGIAQDDLNMNTLGTPYIHSRHTGLMPYWGPCYRCSTQMVSEPACTVGTPPVTLASWTNSGNSSCGGYESDSFTASTQCSTSGVVQLVVTNSSYNPADTTGKVNYGVTIPLSIPNGGNYGSAVNMNDVFGGNNCSQNFDWYPSYAVTGEDVNGTFNGTVTFGNYLSPSQYAQSPSFPVVFQNYKLVAVRTCHQYAPTSSECQTPPPPTQTNLPVYQWACDIAESGWQPGGICSNSLISGNGAEWIFGANDGLSGTAQSGYSVMEAQYDNPTNLGMPATLTFAADNFGWVWINGQQVGYKAGFSTLDTVSIMLPPGTDTIDFMVMNDPNAPVSDPSEFQNPAAGILAISNSSGQALIGTNDTNWYLVDNPPAAPVPSPSSLLAGTGYTPQNCAAGGC